MEFRNLAQYKYQLIEDVTFTLGITGIPIETEFIILLQEGLLVIRKGYAWDGASGPTWDDKTNMRAGLIHDVLYQLIREQKLHIAYREYADRLFYRLLLEDGMSRFRAWYYYKAVSWFGDKYAQSK